MLSFLADVEKAVLADLPQPLTGGDWAPVRTVNYAAGVARLVLNIIEGPERPPNPAGSVTVRGSRLADGSLCLRVELTWTGRPESALHTIVTKPGVDWLREARLLACTWGTGLAEEPAVVAEGRDYKAAV